MLVLTRGQGESITSDGPMEIRVLRVRGNKVRIGIVADKRVHVLRTELADTPEEASP